jgi:alginate O-acetyltransferase complex protein AlgI
MVFNSYTFIIFFAVVLAFYFSGLAWRTKKILLIVASYIFYAAWNPPFVLLLILSTVVDWELSQRIHYATSTRLRRLYLIASLSVNLGLLGFFKYGNFLLESFTGIVREFGVVYQAPTLDIILPVGISFYTFQTLSYSLDVYRRRLDPWHSFIDYALFVTFFPQLVAGPIVRARDFLHQTIEPKIISARHLGWGLSLMILGLFQKVVIADGLLAPVVEKVYDSSQIVSPLAAGIGTLAFSGQILFDFSGYSTIAIGAAMCLGFALPDNFRFPYAAVGFADFWRRWHISLSSWLRDYLYISLGGSRHGTFKTYRNLMVTMLLGGLWHGASWTFVVWGGLHGLYLVLERGAVAVVGSWAVWLTLPGRIFLGLVTFGMVSLAWVFFRAPSFDKAFEIVQAGLLLLPQSEVFVSGSEAIMVIVVMAILLTLQWSLRDITLEQAAGRIPSAVQGTILGIMLALVAMSPGEDRAFIYFQF